MEKYRSIGLSVVAMACCATLFGQSVFATNPYGITYSGGAILGSDNVQIDANLVDGLVPVDAVVDDATTVTVSDSALWNEGYYKYSDDCHEMKYFRVWSNDQAISSSNLSFKSDNGEYYMDIRINNVFMENITDASEDGNFYAIGVNLKSGELMAGRVVYSDAECNVAVENSVSLKLEQEARIFVEMNTKLYKKASPRDSLFTSNGLYIKIADIDTAQSYKILNYNNLLSRDNMYAASASGLQPESSDLKNIFVSSDNYIYSEYSGDDFFNIRDGENNVFVKLTEDTLNNGLDIVFGYARGANSALAYYSKQYKVTYISDENGEISGITGESVLAGGNPTGSLSDPNDEYKFTHWVADKDVVLKDGTTIKAGEYMTLEQVKQVTVNEDLVFEAIHVSVLAPDTGSSMMESNAELIGVSILWLSLVAMAGIITPRLMHKKVGFKRK